MSCNIIFRSFLGQIVNEQAPSTHVNSACHKKGDLLFGLSKAKQKKMEKEEKNGGEEGKLGNGEEK